MIKIPYKMWWGRYSPIINVELSKNDNKVQTLAFLDTGATYSVFKAELCNTLGIDLRSGKQLDIAVGDGNHIPVYLHDVFIKVENMEFKAKIGFSKELGIGMNVIGRDYVMDEYVICFDGIRKEILWKTA